MIKSLKGHPLFGKMQSTLEEYWKEIPYLNKYFVLKLEQEKDRNARVK